MSKIREDAKISLQPIVPRQNGNGNAANGGNSEYEFEEINNVLNAQDNGGPDGEQTNFLSTAGYARRSNSCAQQLKLMLWKNFIIAKRNPKQVVFVFFLPILVCGFIVWMQALADSVVSKTLVNPPVQPPARIPRCQDLGYYPKDCVSFAYAVSGPEEDWVKYTVEHVRAANGLSASDIMTVATNRTLLRDAQEYLNEHPGKVQVLVEFCTNFTYMPYVYVGSNVTVLPYPIPHCQYNVTVPRTLDRKKQDEYPPVHFDRTYWYKIYVNSTLSTLDLFDVSNKGLPSDQTVNAVKRSIDEAIIRWEKGEKARYNSGADSDDYDDLNGNANAPSLFSLNIETQLYPFAPNRFFVHVDMMYTNGAFFFFMTPMFVFIVFVGELVREKEHRLRHGLNAVGVSHGVYWASWAISSAIFAFVVTLYTVCIAYAFQFRAFLDAPFWLYVIFFFLFALAMQSLAFLVAIASPTLKTANSVSYGFVLLSIVIELFITSPSTMKLLYNSAVKPWVGAVKFFLYLYPPYTYSLIFANILLRAGYHFDTTLRQFTLGDGFAWSDITQGLSGQLTPKISFEIPSPLQNLGVLVASTLFYALIGWYCDHVVKENRGRSLPLYFFLTRAYWRGRSSALLDLNNANGANGNALREDDHEYRHEEESVTRERDLIREEVRQGKSVSGIRICGLKKTYVMKTCCKTRTVEALKSVYLKIPSGQLCCVLGHNGAGKTTLINILTGFLSYDAGEVSINNKDLTHDIEEIRREISFCPQFDILWEDLTAAEHVELFARVKGYYAQEDVNEIVRTRLRDVGLSKVAHAASKTFSGGMKRRLSLALASIGDPAIIFLDEPTTGMDPKSRRQVWKLIQRIKRHKAIIMTTHSMDEADVLSDRIAVVVDGRLKCVGTSLFLKNRFGGGYRVSLIAHNEQDVQAIKDALIKNFPSARLLDCSGAQLVFAVPIGDNVEEVARLFDALEGRGVAGLEQMTKMVKDWGVSHATLEEVFMNVTGKKVSKFTEEK